ncbi:unnamed protein product [Rotaria sp. Silwood1]|nr:unnamed protein product [Rotaria sp. Silwood1]
MENTEVSSIQNDETTPVIETVTEETSKTIDEQPAINEDTSKTDVEPTISEDTAITNNEQMPTEDTTKSNDEQSSITTTEETAPILENKEEEEEVAVAPTTIEEEKTTSIDEQENVTDSNSTVSTASISPNRINIPLKEVNESEKEESIILTNGADNTMGKKRELEQEDEKLDATNGDDERTGDQSKKIKISEVTDTPIMESNETENMIMNGTTAVEV